MPIYNEYPISNSVRVRAVFRDANGALTDPAVVEAKLYSPAAGVTDVSGSVVQESTGKYYVVVPIDAVGIWRATFIGDDARLETAWKGVPSVFQ